MKKIDVVNLIQYHIANDDMSFRTEAYNIARDFDQSGDEDLAAYVLSLLSPVGTFSSQTYEPRSEYLTKVAEASTSLPLPTSISNEIKGIINAVNRHRGVNKFLFQGAPGTGKTESVKQIARLLNRTVYAVDFSRLVDSRLGQTGKNISALFTEIDRFPDTGDFIVLLDEIDALVLDRSSENDLREMGRAASIFLREFDALRDDILIIATTNLYDGFDRAIIRRIDYVVDFNQYSDDDLKDIAEILYIQSLEQFGIGKRDRRLFRKIIEFSDHLPNPGELANAIKTCIAFSNPDDDADYLKRLYRFFTGREIADIAHLSKQGFTIREIETLTNVSRSTISRTLKEAENAQQ